MTYALLTLAVLMVLRLEDPEYPTWVCVRFGQQIEEHLDAHHIPDPIPFRAAGRAVAVCTLGAGEESPDDDE